MNKILTFLVTFCFCFCVAIIFVIVYEITKEWIIFYRYGWIWKEYIYIPLNLWDVLFTNIFIIFIITICITPITFKLILLWKKKINKKANI